MSYDNSPPTLNYFCKFPNFPPASETGLKRVSTGGFRGKNRARGGMWFYLKKRNILLFYSALRLI